MGIRSEIKYLNERKCAKLLSHVIFNHLKEVAVFLELGLARRNVNQCLFRRRIVLGADPNLVPDKEWPMLGL